MALLRTEYHVLRPGLAPDIAFADLPTEPGYYALKEVIEPYLDGGRLEHVTVLYDGRRRDMFVDEIGIQKGLPRNERATEIYRAASIARDPRLRLDPEQLSPIYGPAILFPGRQVWF